MRGAKAGTGRKPFAGVHYARMRGAGCSRSHLRHKAPVDPEKVVGGHQAQASQAEQVGHGLWRCRGVKRQSDVSERAQLRERRPFRHV